MEDHKMEDWKMQNQKPTTGIENAGTNNYAEYNIYNHSQMLKAGERRLVPTFSV